MSIGLPWKQRCFFKVQSTLNLPPTLQRPSDVYSLTFTDDAKYFSFQVKKSNICTYLLSPERSELSNRVTIVRWIIAVSMHLKKTANLRMNRKEGRRHVSLDIFFYSIFILQHGCGSYIFPISILHVLKVGYEVRKSRGAWTSAFYVSKSKLHIN